MRPSFSLQVLWILVFASAGLSTPTVQIKETKRVLIINVLGPTNPAYIRMDDQIRAVLESSPYQIELYHEYLETLLFPHPAKQAQFEDSIIAKCRNIARELHDDICHSLAMLSHRIEKVTQGVGRGQIPVSDQLEQIWQQCSALTGDVQAWSHELHTCLGVGFDTTTPKNKEGLGLVGMHERIHLLNGTITIDSKPSAGARIHARVPMLTHSNAMTSAAS